MLIAARDQYERTVAVVTRHWDQLNQDLHTLLRASCPPTPATAPEPLLRKPPFGTSSAHDPQH
jgi:hypothetical protein